MIYFPDGFYLWQNIPARRRYGDEFILFLIEIADVYCKTLGYPRLEDRVWFTKWMTVVIEIK